LEDFLIFEITAGSIGDSAESKDSDCANIDRLRPSISCRNSIEGLLQTAPILHWK
jgi:hypothetical protein